MTEIKSVFFDMDGTLINYKTARFNSSWEAIGKAVGVSRKWNQMNNYYFLKRHLYKEWFKKEVSMLKGISVDMVKNQIFPIPYSEGIREISPYITSKYNTGIITSGVDIVANKVREELKFDFCMSNKLDIVNDKFSGKIKTILSLWKKDKYFLNVCTRKKLKPKEVCFIGDHLNDIPVFKLAGLSVAFNPKVIEVKNNVDYVIQDFRELRKIL